MKKFISVIMAMALVGSLLVGCSSNAVTTVTTATTTPASTTAVKSDSSAATTKTVSTEKVEIEFFQYKKEAIETFDALIAKFTAANPNITVVQSCPPEAGTVIKTRVTDGDVPDIVAVGADNTYSDLAKAGIFEDLTNSAEISQVQPAYVQIIKDVSGLDKVFAIPYATNANAIIYNKTIFKDQGIAVPTTWEELIAASKKLKAANITPFYFTFGDSWTTLPAFNVLAANTSGADFFTKLKAGETTFTAGYNEALVKFQELLTYGNDDILGKTYADGNAAFANGESAMYCQGIWAIAEIQKANPDIDLGIFPYPVGNPAKVVSGVDLLFSVSASSSDAKKAASMQFIDFLMSQEIASQYIADQKCFSAVIGVTQDNPTLDGIKDAVAKGNLIDFPDHYIPASMTIDKTLQAFASSQDIAATLKEMDTGWNTFVGRQ